MATVRAWLLQLQPDSWQLVDASTGGAPIATGEFAAEQLGDQAQPIEQALRDADYQGEAVVVGLAPEWCLAATISVPSPQMLRKPQLLHYQLEESIPWSAEEYVSDFVGHRDLAFMIAVRHTELAALLEALDELGIVVPVVAPTACLALEDHLAAKDLPPMHELFWQESESVDVFEVRDGRPFQWTRLLAQPVELARTVRLQQLSGVLPAVFVRGLSPEILQVLSEEAGAVTELADTRQCEAAAWSCQRIAQGLQEPLLNLRQGELAGRRRFQALAREIDRLKIAAAVLLVCLAGALWVRGASYERGFSLLEGELTETFAEVFPEKPVPERIASALTDEYQRLRGTRAPTADLPVPTGADVVLETLLSALPQKMRFRMPEIQIDQSRVFLSGEVRSNADADQIAAALREAGFTVDPPRTQRLAEQGFAVKLNSVAQSTRKVEQP